MTPTLQLYYKALARQEKPKPRMPDEKFRFDPRAVDDFLMARARKKKK